MSGRDSNAQSGAIGNPVTRKEVRMARAVSSTLPPTTKRKSSRKAAMDDAAEKNKPLVEDIRLLGRLLGDVIR